MPLTVEPLHPEFVARVTGLDLRQAIAPETVAAITDAINRYAVLVMWDNGCTRAFCRGTSPAMTQ